MRGTLICEQTVRCHVERLAAVATSFGHAFMLLQLLPRVLLTLPPLPSLSVLLGCQALLL